MAYQFEQHEDYLIFKADFLMNEAENRLLLDKLEEYLLDGYVKVIIDLAEMDYLNSTGMTVLIAMLTRSRNAGGEAVMINVNPKIEKLLVVTKLKSVLASRANLDEAIHFLSDPPHTLSGS